MMIIGIKKVMMRDNRKIFNFFGKYYTYISGVAMSLPFFSSWAKGS